MRHIDYRDLTAGVMMIAFGLFVALYATGNYDIGRPDRMGPGFFPAALGWILAALGVVVALLAFRKTIHVLTPPPFALRPLLCVMAAVAVFSLLVERLGLVPATIALTVVAAFAETPFNLRRTAVLGVSLAAIAWLIFSVGLSMTLPAFAAWE